MNIIKHYSEDQYRVYSEFMSKIANESDIVKNVSIYSELNEWIEKNNISKMAIEQMDDRIQREDEGKRPTLKRIK